MPPFKRQIECTAYCSCGYCCNWEWGIKLPGFYMALSPSWLPLRLRKRKKGYLDEEMLPVFAKYWTATSLSGSPYYGFTSNGTYPAQARPPILSALSLMQYHRLPERLLLFPWKLFPRLGTIAADTKYYPFGTKMFVPGYGWGKVEDRGGAIKGPTRIDLYHQSHREAIKWGRRKVEVGLPLAHVHSHPWPLPVQVLVVLPGQSALDSLRVPTPLKSLLKGLYRPIHSTNTWK